MKPALSCTEQKKNVTEQKSILTSFHSVLYTHIYTRSSGSNNCARHPSASQSLAPKSGRGNKTIQHGRTKQTLCLVFSRCSSCSSVSQLCSLLFVFLLIVFLLLLLLLLLVLLQLLLPLHDCFVCNLLRRKFFCFRRLNI